MNKKISILVSNKISDFEFLRKLFLEWIDVAGLEGDESHAYAEFERSIANNNSCFLYAVENEEPVGFILAFQVPWFWTGGNMMLINMWFVSPKSRGNGIGECLLKSIEDIGIENRCEAILVGANRYADRDIELARNSLNKNGYHLFGYQMFKRLN